MVISEGWTNSEMDKKIREHLTIIQVLGSQKLKLEWGITKRFLLAKYEKWIKQDSGSSLNLRVSAKSKGVMGE